MVCIRRFFAATGCIAVAVVTMAIPSHAQTGASSAVRSYIAAAAADPAPYTRYTPGACAQSPRAEWEYWRTRRPDTVDQSPLGNPRVSVNRAAVRACVARFDVAAVAPVELPGLATAYLAADEDAKADTALQRWLTSVTRTTPEQRGWAMVQMVRIYIDATPSRLPSARQILARLDAEGPSMASSRLQARLFLIRAAQYLDDVALLDTLATSAVALGQSLTGDSAKTYAKAIASAWGALADAQSRRDAPDQARKTLDQGFSALMRIDPDAAGSLSFAKLHFYAKHGTRAPAIAATTWINAPSNTVAPAPGRVSLLVFGGPCRTVNCYRGYAFLRRFVAKHPEIAVTLVVSSTGTHGITTVPPDSEAVWVGKYFEARGLKLPIAMWYTGYITRPDGRRIAKPSPNDTYYASQVILESLYGYLVDGSGIVHRLTELNDSSKAMLDREVAQVTREHVNAPPTVAATDSSSTAATAKLPITSWVDTATVYDNMGFLDKLKDLLKGIRMSTAQLSALDKVMKTHEKEKIAALMQFNQNRPNAPQEVVTRRYVKLSFDHDLATRPLIRALLTPEQRIIFDANVKAFDKENGL